MAANLISRKQRETTQASNASDIENQYKVLMKSVKKKLNSVHPIPSNCSIHRVPERLRKVNEDAYTPQLVSIGPFHHGKENLQAMEKHKLQYMRDFICRTPNPEISLEECGKAIVGLKQKAIDCYSETIDFESHIFVEMMLVDGCFILELFMKYSIKNLRDTDDPLFNTAWMITTLKRDLLLLENQLPFFILESLFSSIHLSSDPLSNSLVEFTFSFFNLVLRYDVQLLKKKCSLHGKHLLDLVRNAYLPSPSHKVEGKKSREIPEFVHCATELGREGITFRKSVADNLFEIKFRNGVLDIPALRIQDITESIFRNMIAFEQCCHGCTHLISSYVVFMDSLINTAQDVELLQNKRIIGNYLGGEEEIAVLFNTISKEVAVNGFYYSDLSERVDAYYKARWNIWKATYYKRRWHVWKATLKRDYFSNPWAIISVVAAIVLLGLTVLQSVYTVMSYYPH
ncbi:hypothetical protein ACHQM5_005061 [Ranunculus cassubicifolius]